MNKYTPLAALVISDNRQRREFEPGALNDLAESIAATGLMQAPVVRETPQGMVLVAGERRCRAIDDLHTLGREFKYDGEVVPDGMIPYVTLGELSHLEAWEAELEENIRRVDLTWQERAAATDELMALRLAQAVDKGTDKPTVTTIARELRNAEPSAPIASLGFAPQQVRQEIMVAAHLKDPEIARAPTLREAVKILKKREEVRQQTSLAEITGKSFSMHSHNLLNEDAGAWAAVQAPAQFDIVLTDPIYGIGADKFGDSGVGTSAAAHGYDDSYEAWQDMMTWFPAESYRLTKAEAHLYAFCDIDRFHEMRMLMAAAGWKVHRTPLVWSNPDGFRAPWPEQGCQRKYELILYAVKGNLKVNHLKGDVLEYKKDAAQGHPAQKPVALLVDLLRRSARADFKVIDFFAGSFSTVEACHELRLPCTALERDPAAYGNGVRRIQELTANSKELFA